MDKTEHNWEHRGIHGLAPLPKESGKMDAWLRILLSFVLGAFSTTFYLGGKSRDLNDLLIWKGKTEAQLERMDKEGTNRSHWVDDDQSKQIATNQTRISEGEQRAQQRGEQISVMQGKIERLEGELRDVKERIKK